MEGLLEAFLGLVKVLESELGYAVAQPREGRLIVDFRSLLKDGLCVEPALAFEVHVAESQIYSDRLGTPDFEESEIGVFTFVVFIRLVAKIALDHQHLCVLGVLLEQFVQDLQSSGVVLLGLLDLAGYQQHLRSGPVDDVVNAFAGQVEEVVVHEELDELDVDLI